MKSVVFVTLLLIPVMIGGCYNDVEELLYPVCSTQDITYSGTIQPIMERHCYDCHAGFSPDGELDLSTYNGVQTSATNTIRQEGNLLHRIEKQDSFPLMPYLLPKLDSCDIAKIRRWIDEGALNN